MNEILQFIKKLYTYNHCDTCGFTKDAVYVSEYFLEAGIIQCEKCVLKHMEVKMKSNQSSQIKPL